MAVKHGITPGDGTLHSVPMLLASSLKHVAVWGRGWLGWPLQRCLYQLPAHAESLGRGRGGVRVDVTEERLNVNG